MDLREFRNKVLAYVLSRIEDNNHPLTAEEIVALAKLAEVAGVF